MPHYRGFMNHLYYGDNLDILRRFIKDESVDLIYLDPPFNSKRDYNAVFTGKGGQKAAAQVQAFEDTWRWDESAARAYEEVVVEGNHTGAATCLKAFRDMLGTNDMLAYLSMMAVRLVELRRVLKPTGSIYLHCDPTMSHYLKLLMDGVFGHDCFRNDITWKRTSAHSDPGRFGANTDSILYYTKSSNWTWNQVYIPYTDEYKARYRNADPDGRLWMDDNITAKGLSGGGYTYEYKGVLSLWRCPLETMQRLDAEGRLHFTRGNKGIRLKRYLDEQKGLPAQALWEDIPPINSQAQERLGYPTQKPEALLERIVESSSNLGDIVLDPFCGCGTAVVVAQRLNRKWIGIDITHLAVNLMRTRLIDAFGEKIKSTFDVVGEPTTLEDAEALAEHDKYQFQFWALGLVGARPAASDEKKGADKGIDGKRFFSDEAKGGTKTIIISVKGGKTIPATSVRDLRGTIEREGAEIGVLISIAEPTKNMREDAAAAGFYTSAMGSKHPRIQLLTVQQLMEGKTLDMPSGNQIRSDVQTIKKAKKSGPSADTPDLGL